MKTIEEFLSYLYSLDIKIVVEGDRLRCNAPEGKLTQDLQVELKSRKAEILKFMQQGHLADKTVELIKPVPRDGNLLLSFAQQRLWLLNQLEGPSATYNMPLALLVNGPLQVAALEQAIAEIVRRHEVLRTTFKMVNGSPVQVINPVPSMDLAIVNLLRIEQKHQCALVQQLVKEEAQYPFDLSEDTLLRVKLLQLQQSEHVLLLVMHHIISDGWSLGIFIRELSALYQAFCWQEPSPLPELLIQYADFAYWQRQWLSGEVMETQLNYWQQQLAGAPSLLELPTDRPRPPQQTFRGSAVEFKLSSELTQKLVALSQKSGTTLFMTLLAVFAILLKRHSNQSDIVIGSPIANRNHSGVESLIGFFVNTLVLRIQLEENPTFLELLEQVREKTLGAYEHQDLPFEKLVEELQPERSLSYTPLFQVMFVLQNAPISKLELPHLTMTPLKMENVIAKFDLTLQMEETEAGLSGELIYNKDLFDAATISRMAGHLQVLLEGVAANSQQRIGQLPLLNPSEQHQLLVEWNDTQVDYPQDKCIHQLFEEQVERTPNAVAVVFEKQQLTYRELNNRANQLARYLQTLGVKPEVMVGICVERSLEMIIGLLGIFKAGGAYVPLDPAYPEDRLSFMLSDSQVPVLLTQQKLVANLPECAARIVSLDADWGVISQESYINVNSDVQPENLAYMIYTSGSTGKPKGVLVAHSGLCNLALAQIKVFDVHPDSRVLQFASFSFDASISEVVMTLCVGARLCLGTRESLLPGAGLTQLLQNLGITHVTLPPSALAAMPNAEFPDLRTIIVAGEACPPDLVAQWSKGRRFINGYGPTESTVCATTAVCTNSTSQLPIGRPIDNIQLYILDPYLQPVPIGVPGELHIGGAGLAKGYLNRPELTLEKFIPNPFDNALQEDQRSTKLYKTGDLVRYLPDGNIDFLGRIDQQVKIRGFRIELGEIEAALSLHTDVREAVVVVKEDQPGGKRLVAYIVPNHVYNQERITTSKLRSFLKESLAEYMLPSAFVMLEFLPLTPNGKVDRKALSTMEVAHSELESNLVLPRTSVEEMLADIWAEVLGLEQAGVHSNFFELGGHSLLAVQLISQINQKLEKDIPISTLFQHPTIVELATLVTKNANYSATNPCLVPIQVEGNQPALFCIHGAGGQAMMYKDLATCLGKNQPVYGLQSRALEDATTEHKSIDSMATEYANAIQKHQPNGPYCLMGWSMGGAIAVSVAKQLEKQGLDVAFVVLLDAFLIPENAPTWSDPLLELARRFSTAFADDLKALHPDEKRVLQNELIGLSYFESLHRMMVWGQERNLLSTDICFDSLQKQVALNITHEQLLKGYHPEQIQAKLHVFWAKEGLEAGLLPIPDWSKYTKSTSDASILDGNHYTLVRPPYVKAVAQRLQFAIRNSQFAIN